MYVLCSDYMFMCGHLEHVWHHSLSRFQC